MMKRTSLRLPSDSKQQNCASTSVLSGVGSRSKYVLFGSEKGGEGREEGGGGRSMDSWALDEYYIGSNY
jgi:hypothetical protein